MNTDISVRDLSVSFGNHEVAHGVSFDLTSGRITALVGESGSGKTVSAMALPRLEAPGARVSGGARVAGPGLEVNLLAEDADLHLIRGGLIGTVFQEPATAFNPLFTIGDQIAESWRPPSHTHASHQTTRRVVADQLRAAGLTDTDRIARSYPHQLSGGQLQRAMIAMAVINTPALLIADEPTTSLDVTVQKGILDLIRSLATDSGIAVLLITHDMGIVAEVADDVHVMHDGRIVEHGAVEEVFHHPQDDYTRALLAAVPRLPDSAAEAAFLRGPHVMTEQDSSSASQAGPAVVRVDGLAVAYGRRSPVVEGIAFTAVAGQTVALVGESGSGKTTVARAVSGQLAPAAGTVEIEGETLSDTHRRASRSLLARIGYVFQDNASALNPRRTIGWSIAEPLSVATPEDASSAPTRAEISKRVVELLEQVELPASYAQRYPHQLSGGQRQRVGIARALALSPHLVIADEPTSSLDVTVQDRILTLVERLQEELGFACLFISHDLAVVARIADEVCVMHTGRIVERGTPAQVLIDPQDPYTRELVAASPKLDLSVGGGRDLR